MTPGAPYTALPYPVRWALNVASATPRGPGSRLARPEPRDRVQCREYVVTLARTHLPYGTSAHGRARYAHLVRHYWIAWHRGRPVAARAQWWCGAVCDSTTLMLTAEPARELCPMCQFTIARSVRERSR